MKTTIDEIMQKVQALSDDQQIKMLELLKTFSLPQSLFDSPNLSTDHPIEDDNFEAIADQLAEELIKARGKNLPLLSDYAVSRAGIYEDHP
jgi:hypothetical protein